MTRSRGHLLVLLVVTMTALAAGAARPVGALAQPCSGNPTLETQKVPVEGGRSYTDLGAAVLARMLQKKDFLLVNVHIPYEGEIEGTDLFVPFDQVEASLGKLPADKSARLVLYCRTGGMSAIAARALVKLGYTDVWTLDGGMIAWKQAGYPLIHGR